MSVFLAQTAVELVSATLAMCKNVSAKYETKTAHSAAE